MTREKASCGASPPGGGTPRGNDPRIVAFLCSWCAYAAADRAGQRRVELPHGLLTVRVMCTGRVEPAFVLQAFREGADGVLIAGCHPGDCHYVDGNLRAAARHAVLVRALEQAGVEPGRFRITWAGANDAEKLAAAVREMSDDLAALGPLRPVERLTGAPEDARATPEGSCAAARPDEGDAVVAAAEGVAGERGAPAAAVLGPRAPGRPRIAFYWNASCGGCEEAVIDLGAFEGLLERVEVVLWPLAMDAKRSDVEALPDGGIDVAFVNGAVRLDEQEDWSRLLRRKARLVVAFGACAHMGGVVGLGNLSEPAELLEAAYRRPASVSNPEAPLPGAGPRGPLSLPVLLPRALPLAEVVEVDFTVPGCPPSPAVVQAALDALLGESLPPRGAVLAPNAALCEACPRKGSLPERLEVTALRRLATSAVDPEACFLAQGLVCLGPGTRQGCQPGCLEAGMPCRGCFGPLDGVADAGAAMLSAFASLLTGGEREVTALGAALPDPAGTFWRYSGAAALAPGRVRPAGGRGGEGGA